jgi:hypothetical protein
MHKRLLIQLSILIFLAGHAMAGDAPGTQTLPLKWVALDDAPDESSTRYVRLEKDKRGEMDFATPSGKLRFQLEHDGYIRIDRNEDGAFDEKDKPFVSPKRPTTMVTIRIGNESVNYRLSISGAGDRELPGDNPALFVTSLMALETQAGADRIRILDANCNGRLGEFAGNGGESGDQMQIGEASPVPLQPYLLRDAKLLRVEVPATCQELRLAPYAGPVSTLAVSVKDGYAFTASLQHKESGYLTEEIQRGHPVLSLPGSHRIYGVGLHYANPLDPAAKDADQEPAVVLSGASEQPPVELKEGANERAFGPPLKLEFLAARSTKDPTAVEIKDVWLTGVGVERYTAQNYGQESAQALQCLLRHGERTVVASKLSYG